MLNPKFKSLIENYADHWILHHIPNPVIPNIEQAAIYLEKYGLTNEIYNKNWLQLHHSIFDTNKQLPEMVFKKNFEYITLLGGAIFSQRDFEMLKVCLQKTGDKYFVIIQDTWGIPTEELDCTFKMQYPANISWEELMSGNYISAVLFDADINNYYVFGDSGKWGKYVGTEYNDELSPIDIIGFDKVYRKVFRDSFNIPEGMYCEDIDFTLEGGKGSLKEDVPPAYRNETLSS